MEDTVWNWNRDFVKQLVRGSRTEYEERSFEENLKMIKSGA
jgi:hypothetical protein